MEKLFSRDRPDLFPRIWNNLTLISCWGDGAAQYQLQQLQTRFPGIAVQKKGLLATEGVVSFPLEQAGGSVIAYDAHFFEFIEQASAPPRLLWEIEPGKTYTVLLTTGGGLYRYNLQDKITVTDLFGDLPVVTFVGRTNTADMVGEKLEEAQVQQALDAVLARRGSGPPATRGA